MKKITISTPKGGEGKSSLSILLANFLAYMGNKVLVIDLDPQNSTSFHFVLKEDHRNIARAFHNGDIVPEIIESVAPGIDICQSDLALLMQRAMPTHHLKKLLVAVESLYDFVIIDTAPTWDNIVINGLRAADLIIYPSKLKNKFSVKTATFFRRLLSDECPELLEKYCILYNWYMPGPEGQQYVDLYETVHERFFDTHLRSTAQIKNVIDYGTPVTPSKKFDVLYPFLYSLSGEIYDYFGLSLPDGIPADVVAATSKE